MLRPRHGLLGVICAWGCLTAACAARVPVVATPLPAPVVVAAVPVVPVPPPAPDPVIGLIALSTSHFEIGQRELQLGHLETAKAEFNQALAILLESQFGARSEPRIREHFDRLVERISAFEVTALGEGDGFAEKNYDAASLDQLLAILTFEQPAATSETKDTIAADLQFAAHDIDIPLNAKVLSFVELFTGRLKGYLEDGLSRGARFLPMIQDVFRAEGLPLDLAYVPLVESAFKPNAVSRAQAKGLWQFMSGTGLENGLKNDWYLDERAEPEKATRAAAKYLKTLYAMFGDWHLALASYNGGPGRVQRAMKVSKRDDFWTLSSSPRFLPQETRDYVPLILAAMIIARNPAQYGMNIQPLDPPRFERVLLPKAADIRRIAEWAGSPVQMIQDLNPELRRWTTPVREKDYELKVPEGTADAVRARLSEADPDSLASLNWHTVRKGETLLTISKTLKVSRTDLAEANYLSLKSRVEPGQQLIIPRPPTLLLAARTDKSAPLAESRPIDAVVAVNTDGSVTVPIPEQTNRAKLTYSVKRGDTLFSIARLFDTTVAALRSWNSISGSAIQIGQRLTVFTIRTTANATH